MSSQAIQHHNIYSPPLFYRLSKASDKESREKLIKSIPFLQIHDSIKSQLIDLIKSLFPKIKSDPNEIERRIVAHLNGVSLEAYGVWVYYPWSNRLVHLLDEEEFAFVRTSRNTYKITPEERQTLATKKVGVIGLSVGQSVALTLAMERGFGELRIADFDLLDLSNLNRIRTGVHNLDVPKTVITAREIAEIDPFLKVVVYDKGVSEDNIDHFLCDGGKLDVLIEVCDGLDIKVVSRNRAKAHGIPVVMDTSDKGMLDVERFDLEPSRPILHGLIDHLDTSRLKGLSNEQKIPFILPMTGAETLTPRLKASMIEVEETVPSWPQLASSVALGGALGADVCRRIMLDQFHDSGRYYVDLESIITDTNKTFKNVTPLNYYDAPPLTLEAMEAMVKSITNKPLQEGQLLLTQEQLQQLISSANTAPSGGNCQPWKWLSKGHHLFLFYEKARNRSFLDYDDVSAYSSLGAALENITLATHQMGMEIQITNFPVSQYTELVAHLSFFGQGETKLVHEPHVNDHWANAIHERHTNRLLSIRTPISIAALEKLKNAAETVPGAIVQFTDSATHLEELKEIFAAADRIRLLHPQGHHDLFYNEIRWTPEENALKRDGVDIATVDITASEFAGFKLAKDPQTIALLRDWNKGDAFKKMTRKTIDSASAIGFVTMPLHDKVNFLNGGRAWQRLWLQATEEGIGLQPLLVPLMFFIRHVHGNAVDMPREMSEEISLLRQRFETIFRIPENCAEVFLFRLNIAEKPKVASLRLPIENTLISSK